MRRRRRVRRRRIAGGVRGLPRTHWDSPRLTKLSLVKPAADPFVAAKNVPIENILEWLELGTIAAPICPCCRSTDSRVAIVGNCMRCTHSRCVAKAFRDGLRSTIDLVAEACSVKAIEAVRAMGEQFGFEVPKRVAKPALPRPVSDLDTALWGLTETRQGELHRTTGNAVTILTNDPEWHGVLAWDELKQRIVARRPPPWDALDAAAATAGDWEDVDDVRLAAWLMRRYRLQIGKESAHDASDLVARKHSFDPVREYLLEVVWDQKARLDTWLVDYLAVIDTEYSRLVGPRFMIGAVARALEPGCKLDTMLVLEGEQGEFKSSAIAALFGKRWVNDTPPVVETKDRFLAMSGFWCVEWSELDGWSRAEMNSVKAFLSSATDTYRPAYGRANITVPRRSCFVGTVNGDDYCRDETGNRRLLPVKCAETGHIRKEAIAEDRDQLWAEAVARYRCADPEISRWWYTKKEERSLLAPEQSARREGDPWDHFVDAYCKVNETVTVADILDRIGIDKCLWDRVKQSRVLALLKARGFRRRQIRDGFGLQKWVYAKTRDGSVQNQEIQQDLSPLSPDHLSRW